MGKNDEARALVEKWCRLDSITKSEKQKYLLLVAIAHTGTQAIDCYVKRLTTPASKDFVLSIHNMRLYIQQKLNLKSGSEEQGNQNLNKALTLVDKALDNPLSDESKAQLLSQKAHVIRLQGKPEKEWRALFNEALCLDPSRQEKNKMEDCRADEHKVLRALKLM